MIDVKNMSFDQLQELKKEIAAIENEKTRTYNVSFKITFRANRVDDLADPGQFSDHVYDMCSYWNLKLPEQITDITVTEI